MTAAAPRFTLADMDAANAAWGANCGPGALAAIAGLTLDQVRPHMGDFEDKGYTNPTLMFAALDSLGLAWRGARTARRRGAAWPAYGLARIQWEGPWTQPGVSLRARYRHTHWVGAARRVGVFDVNALANGTGWVALDDWTAVVVPWILEHAVPRASGGWHITHAIEIEAPRGKADADAQGR